MQHYYCTQSTEVALRLAGIVEEGYQMLSMKKLLTSADLARTQIVEGRKKATPGFREPEWLCFREPDVVMSLR